MSKVKNKEKHIGKFLYFAVLFFFVCSTFMLVFILVKNRGNSKENLKQPEALSNVADNSNIVKNKGTISIPGFEGLEFIADTTDQNISLSNPANNNCLFVIQLFLDDGTLLWESELIEPGQISDPIVLSKPLSAGNYPNSLIKYSCFKDTDEGLIPLNGAETKLTLWVKNTKKGE